MKILNLYSGVGGNRRLWGDEHEITAIEIQEDIARAYQDFFPNDTVIVTDAANYLLDNYLKFDFIWASPPCQTHSKARKYTYKNNPKVKKVYPDLTLYQIILFLTHHHEKLWVVENVNPYYNPFIPPTRKIGRHLFWSNFNLRTTDIQTIDTRNHKNMKSMNQQDWIEHHGFDLSNYKFKNRKDQIYRNCVNAEVGKYILNCAMDKYNYSENTIQLGLFNTP